MNIPLIGNCTIPLDFKYMEVIRKGVPERDQYFYMQHPKMPCGKRAKIFAPFAALKGFEEEVESKEVIYVKKKELDADEYYELNDTLRFLQERTKTRRAARNNRIRAQITYYVVCSDDHNEAYQVKGTYETVDDVVLNVDPYEQRVLIGDESIRFADIYSIRVYGQEDEGNDRSKDSIYG